MKRTLFFLCRHCGNLVMTVENTGISLYCCGEEMQKLEPNTSEASGEKHLPVAWLKQGCLEADVGSAAHPMEEKHHIAWIALEEEQGIQLRYLSSAEAPHAVFQLAESVRPLRVYAYCNLHGLWKTEI